MRNVFWKLQKNRVVVTSLALFFLTFFLLGQNISKPFVGEHDWNGVRYGNIARNYLRYGLWNLKFSQIENSGFVRGEDYIFFTHYPPLLPILLAGSFTIFGITEWAARLVPIVATSGSVVLIFLLGRELFNFRVGFLASVLVIPTPLVLYFGKTPVHEPLVVFFMLLAYFGYLQRRETKYKILFIFGLIFAHLSTWAGYFLLPGITLEALLRKDLREAKSLIVYWAIPLTLFTLHVFQAFFTTGSLAGGNLDGAFLLRSGISAEGRLSDFNIISYAERIRLWFFNMYTIPLCLLSAVWIVRGFILKRFLSEWRVYVLAIPPLAYFLIFPNAVFIHNYLVFYFLPFMALSASLGLGLIEQSRIMRNDKFALSVLALALVALERSNVNYALQKSNADYFSVSVAKAINAEVPADARVLVTPPKFFYGAEKFLRFYGDRSLVAYKDADVLKYDIEVKVDTERGSYEIARR